MLEISSKTFKAADNYRDVVAQVEEVIRNISYDFIEYGNLDTYKERVKLSCLVHDHLERAIHKMCASDRFVKFRCTRDMNKTKTNAGIEVPEWDRRMILHSMVTGDVSVQDRRYGKKWRKIAHFEIDYARTHNIRVKKTYPKFDASEVTLVGWFNNGA